MQTHPIEISKEQAIAAYDGNASSLARALGVSPQAIYQWPDGPIAESHSLKLQFVLLPTYPWKQPAKRAA